jgi:myo-inositol-1(or 4)-monophosphatase
MNDAVLMTTDAHLFDGAEAAAFERVRKAAKLTRYGFDCYAYCMVAAGPVDAVIESGLKPFDIQALMPIVQGAGGSVTNWRGGDCAQGGQTLACGDARVRDAIMALAAGAAR